jgi:hypothetical protein
VTIFIERNEREDQGQRYDIGLINIGRSGARNIRLQLHGEAPSFAADEA